MPQRRGGQKVDLKFARRSGKVGAMTTLARTPANEKKLAQLKAALGDVLTQALKRGFFGSVAVELSVQDGTIQSIRRKLERVER